MNELLAALYEIRDHIRENDEPDIDLLHDLANKAIIAEHKKQREMVGGTGIEPVTPRVR